MVKIEKETKIKLLEAIEPGWFNGELFPELQKELSKITFEVIDKTGQIDKDVSYLLDN